jgi:ubiquinone biosynthesis protein Coq4
MNTKGKIIIGLLLFIIFMLLVEIANKPVVIENKRTLIEKITDKNINNSNDIIIINGNPIAIDDISDILLIYESQQYLIENINKDKTPQQIFDDAIYALEENHHESLPVSDNKLKRIEEFLKLIHRKDPNLVIDGIYLFNRFKYDDEFMQNVVNKARKFIHENSN